MNVSLGDGLILIYCIFFSCEMEVFSPYSPKHLDPAYKMDLDFWDCLRRERN